METKDQWREDLEPRAAIAAWTIPKLEEENNRLREMLYQIEAENNTLASQLQESVQGTGDSEEKTLRLLKKLDRAGFGQMARTTV
ncbi:hypothetical protein EDD85DRAFT_946473 [Armillaria nabsnona]|nr:hypothetical protein EDD85DRAFT_946473 [Armillaria nabsnona]